LASFLDISHIVLAGIYPSVLGLSIFLITSTFSEMTRVYVGHIPYEAQERDVERFFKGYGRIRDILLKRGYCFVEFSDPRDADDAVHDLNGRSLMGMR
jgi:arginine/serine-rich splicing factor 4/5/6